MMSDDLDLAELEARVQQTKKELDALWSKSRGPHGDQPIWAMLVAASKEFHAAQGALAAARGEEWAEPLTWDPAWNTGAPSPHVVASGLRTYVVYLANEPDPEWDGTYVNVIRPTDDAPMLLATVCFDLCYWHKFGGPNDEVFHGHPLASRGFNGQGVFLVHNSRWLEEARAINSVHSQYNPKTWTKLRHYLLAFHDDTFECLAKSHEITVARESFASALTRCAQQILSR